MRKRAEVLHVRGGVQAPGVHPPPSLPLLGHEALHLLRRNDTVRTTVDVELRAGGLLGGQRGCEAIQPPEKQECGDGAV